MDEEMSQVKCLYFIDEVELLCFGSSILACS